MTKTVKFLALKTFIFIFLFSPIKQAQAVCVPCMAVAAPVFLPSTAVVAIPLAIGLIFHESDEDMIKNANLIIDDANKYKNHIVKLNISTVADFNSEQFVNQFISIANITGKRDIEIYTLHLKDSIVDLKSYKKKLEQRIRSINNRVSLTSVAANYNRDILNEMVNKVDQIKKLLEDLRKFNDIVKKNYRQWSSLAFSKK